MVVIPFRKRPSPPGPPAPRMPPPGQLLNAYLKTSICLFLYPWVRWLDLLREHDDYSGKDYD